MPNASVSPVLARRTRVRISSCSGESVMVLGSMGAVCIAPAVAGGAIPANGHVFGIRLSHTGKGKSACLHTLEMNPPDVYGCVHDHVRHGGLGRPQPVSSLV